MTEPRLSEISIQFNNAEIIEIRDNDDDDIFNPEDDIFNPEDNNDCIFKSHWITINIINFNLLHFLKGTQMFRIPIINDKHEIEELQRK